MGGGHLHHRVDYPVIETRVLNKSARPARCPYSVNPVAARLDRCQETVQLALRPHDSFPKVPQRRTAREPRLLLVGKTLGDRGVDLLLALPRRINPDRSTVRRYALDVKHLESMRFEQAGYTRQ